MPPPPKRQTLETEDFYYEGSRMVLTAAFHLKRGKCCGNGCRHCPYEHIAVPQPETTP
jgi:hypothetical protein